MTHFSWLHLTDLHCGQQEHSWLLPGVQDIFFEDLKRLYQKCGPWDLVLFTGDLTQKGTTEDFQKAQVFLEQLWKCFETFDAPLPTLLAVPGNHDLVRPAKKTAVVRMLTGNFSEIQEEFWDHTAEEGEEYRQIVTTAFEKYMTWWKTQPLRATTITSGLLPGDFSVTLEKDGAKLGIVGLNTSFLQLTDDNYNGKLALHTRQFHRACDGDGIAWAKKHQACLLLTHHPPTWLNETSRQHLNAEITAHGRFALHLCGHNHEAAMREQADGGTEFRRSWQGWSLFGLEHFGPNNEDQRLHGYAAGRIELSGAKGTVSFWPRKASLQGGVQRKIVPDYENFDLTDDQHTRPREFDLLQSYRVDETGEDLKGFQKPFRSDEPKEATLPLVLRQKI